MHDYLKDSIISIFSLNHWGRVTHICVSKLAIIGSDNGLSPGRRQAIIWINVKILLIRSLGTEFSEILIKIDTFSLKKRIWKCRLENGGHFVSASMCYSQCFKCYRRQTWLDGMTTHNRKICDTTLWTILSFKYHSLSQHIRMNPGLFPSNNDSYFLVHFYEVYGGHLLWQTLLWHHSCCTCYQGPPDPIWQVEL